MRKVVLLIVAVNLVAGMGFAQNLLINADLESPGAPGGQLGTAVIDDWLQWGSSGWYTTDHGPDNMDVKFWSDDTGIYQNFDCTAGTTYQFDSIALNPSGGDQLSGRTGDMKAEWYTAGDVKIGDTMIIDSLTDAATPDTWYPLSGSMEAPVDAARGRFVFGVSAAGGGVAFFDDASVTAMAIPEPTAAVLMFLGVIGVFAYRRSRK